MLCGKGDSSLQMYNGIKKDFNISAYIEEEKPSVKRIVKRRIKKLGVFKVINQLFFQLIIPRILYTCSRKRIEEIRTTENLDNSPVPPEILHRVSSVNSTETIEILKEMKPDVIIVNGTRIIGKKVLGATNASFINTHVGITPEYRGVHGAYWALLSSDPENCGVTIHRVDTGIDTGEIIRQEIIQPTKRDNFCTYPLLQMAKAIEMMRVVLKDIEIGVSVRVDKTEAKSKLWYHPTFTGYLINRIIRGIK